MKSPASTRTVGIPWDALASDAHDPSDSAVIPSTQRGTFAVGAIADQLGMHVIGMKKCEPGLLGGDRWDRLLFFVAVV